MNFFKGLLVIIAVIMVATLMLGALMIGARDFQTQSITDEFSITTGGAATATVQLAKTLWEATLSYVTVSSNISADAPIAQSYNATSREVVIGGLSATSLRTLIINYKTDGLVNFSAPADALKGFPTAIILALIVIALVAVVYAVSHH